MSETFGEGTTEKVFIILSGYSSRIFEMSKVPIPLPVPPPKEWVSWKPLITVYILGQKPLSACWLFCWTGLNQRPDQYKMKILVFSIQYDFQILKYQYQYSIWRILNKYQYQYAKKTEVSVFSISILSGKKCEKNSKPSKCEKLRFLLNRH